MPNRKSDATQEGSPKPEADAALPPPGAESEPVEAAAMEPVGPAAETVTVDAAAAHEPEAPLEPVPAEAEAGVAEEEAREEQAREEEAGRSFAARALTLLLVLLAGAALGIWGAPKLAPLLPSGLAPVAEWLTPGRRQAEEEVAALRARVDESVGGLEARVAELSKVGDVGAQIKTAVDATASRLSGDIGTLQKSVDALGGADTVQRVAKLESAAQGQAAELAALKDQLSGAAAATGQLSSEAAQKIDVYRAELDGLRAEMGAIQEKVAGLGARVDEVAANADRQIATAQTKVNEVQSQADTALSAAATQSDVALIRAAIASGQPFAAPLKQLAGRPGVAVAPDLEAAAPGGVATMAELRDSFSDAAHAAIRASIVAGAGEGFFARSRAFLQAEVASRSLTPQQGNGPDAVLSRMEDKLRRDDLKGALAESAALPSESAAAMADWIQAARLREGALEGMAALETAVPATN